MIFFFWGGGGEYLSQVRKKCQIFGFSEDCMFGLTLANTYFFSLSQTETFRLINVIMKL